MQFIFFYLVPRISRASSDALFIYYIFSVVPIFNAKKVCILHVSQKSQNTHKHVLSIVKKSDEKVINYNELYRSEEILLFFLIVKNLYTCTVVKCRRRHQSRSSKHLMLLVNYCGSSARLSEIISNGPICVTIVNE